MFVNKGVKFIGDKRISYLFMYLYHTGIGSYFLKMKKEVVDRKANPNIDITKFVMAILTIGIHTEPFGFNMWLDYGFGIATRFCVPFFFVASSYFFWIKPRKPLTYIKRILSLYVIWSLIYLPFDLPLLKGMAFEKIVWMYFWEGNGHSLWFLWGSVVAFLMVFLLKKVINSRQVFMVSVVFLVIGCMKSTWAPMINRFLPFEVCDFLGSRNGLFYAFPYVAMGMLIAENPECKGDGKAGQWGMLVLSVMCLIVEGCVLVLHYQTPSRILWLSVLPCTYYFFILVKDADFAVSDKVSCFLRKMSTLIYLGHGLFLILFKELETLRYFSAVFIAVSLLAISVIKLSEKKFFGWMKCLY